MNAYQDLMTALVARRPGQSAGEDDRIVRAALDKHAHELAEQQRAWALDYPGDRVDSSYDDGIVRGAELAADEIDPHVGAGPWSPAGSEETTT